jgi:hypothetical protein
VSSIGTASMAAVLMGCTGFADRTPEE